MKYELRKIKSGKFECTNIKKNNRRKERKKRQEEVKEK